MNAGWVWVGVGVGVGTSMGARACDPELAQSGGHLRPYPGRERGCPRVHGQRAGRATPQPEAAHPQQVPTCTHVHPPRKKMNVSQQAMDSL